MEECVCDRMKIDRNNKKPQRSTDSPTHRVNVAEVGGGAPRQQLKYGKRTDVF